VPAIDPPEPLPVPELADVLVPVMLPLLELEAVVLPEPLRELPPPIVAFVRMKLPAPEPERLLELPVVPLVPVAPVIPAPLPELRQPVMVIVSLWLLP